MRIQHLIASVTGAKELSRREPARPRPLSDRGCTGLEQARRAGELPTASSNGEAHNALALRRSGGSRLDHLESCLDAIREAAVPGDFGRLRHRARRHVDLHGGVPRRPRDLRPRRVGRRPVRGRRSARRGWARVVPTRPEYGARGVRPLRAARRPGSLPAGTRQRDPGRSADRGDRAAAGRSARSRRRFALLHAPLRPGTTGGFVVIDDYGSRVRRGSRCISARARSTAARSSASAGTGPCWRKTRSAMRSAPRTGTRHPRRAAHQAAGPIPVGGRRLPQHAPRGRAHPALALALVPAGTSRTSTTR